MHTIVIAIVAMKNLLQIILNIDYLLSVKITFLLLLSSLTYIAPSYIA
jgi:hypothetical protein